MCLSSPPHVLIELRQPPVQAASHITTTSCYCCHAQLTKFKRFRRPRRPPVATRALLTSPCARLFIVITSSFPLRFKLWTVQLHTPKMTRIVLRVSRRTVDACLE
ncbi:hypothetical protein L596_017956 [Steinernema carpocapsae]|uniref:Uncharacterized protein n=1 Tax=Steinernema carpocapsae TaxID=34508 RepID=A0A4U5N3N2_STECR|nr:hypothetical protein L596_017956 [Steinernema carpocapsae]